MTTLPETLVEAIEHLVRRLLRTELAVPIMGIVTGTNPLKNTCDVKPYGRKPLLRDIPTYVAPLVDPVNKPASGIAVRPQKGAKALVGFVNGSWEMPFLIWADKLDAAMIHGTLAVYILSEGMVEIKSDTTVLIQGRPVLDSTEPI